MWDRWTRHWRLTRRSSQRLQRTREAKKQEGDTAKAPARDACDDASCATEKKALSAKTTRRRMAKKPSPTKTRTGNALAQFVILSALTVVAYQFIATRLYAPPASAAPSVELDGISPVGSSSPSPWTDAALEKYRAKQRAADREVISTTEFSCFMACVGLFGLMQHNKKRSEEEAIEAQRRAVEMRILRGRDGDAKLKRATSDEATSCLAEIGSPSAAGCDSLAALPSDVQQEVFCFLSVEELVECAMVNHAWQDAAGDPAEKLWKARFASDYGESGERFEGIVPRICWRQYYFLHRLSRAVELARWLDAVEQRKCVVIQGHVYDVTSFLDAHPGGYHVIGDVLGTDATELWDQFQHSTEAKELMKDFLIVDDLLLAWDPRGNGEPVHPRKNLAVVERRWHQISWCLSHAHLLGGLSNTFLNASFKFVVWRTTSKPRSCRT